MLIDKPRCNFKNCRFYFDGNCRSADIYENCKLTDLRSEIAKLTVGMDNAKAEVARDIFEDIENNYADFLFDGYRNIVVLTEKDFAELKKKYKEEKT